MPDFYEKVYEILITHAGASPAYREDFLTYFRSRGSRELPAHVTKEWRFMGRFGFGGKIWIDSLRPFAHVTYYPEDRTDEREKVLESVNKHLREIS